MTNVNIPISPELHKRIKLQAVREDRTIKDLIISILEKNMQKR